MKRIKGRSVVEYLIQFASDTRNSADRRKTALAALEGGVDKNNAADIERIFNIAKDDNTPDEVRDLAFNRLGELPKEQVVPRLYTLFTAKKWKVRWVAAQQVLKIITPAQIPEFMSHLPATPAVKMGHERAAQYGGILLAKMRRRPPRASRRCATSSCRTSTRRRSVRSSRRSASSTRARRPIGRSSRRRKPTRRSFPSARRPTIAAGSASSRSPGRAREERDGDEGHRHRGRLRRDCIAPQWTPPSERDSPSRRDGLVGRAERVVVPGALPVPRRVTDENHRSPSCTVPRTLVLMKARR